MSVEKNDILEETKEVVSKNFIEQIIDKDLAEGVYDNVHTRFPPEPNGYLHIGHAKSILLNYGLAQKYNGKFNMRFDDTNPTKEKIEFVESIKADIQWLGADWEDRLFFASDYFQEMYEGAIKLIKKGKAYVSDLTAEQIREYRGTLTEPGKEDPGSQRSIEENLQLFEAMKNDKFADGEKVLRARIDMASPNMNMRDPVIYRVAHIPHHNTGDQWVIYPMYDFAHSLSDYIEHISNSLCSLEFEDHRPLYNWCVEQCQGAIPDLPAIPPEQYEFSRLNIERFVMSKRWLKRFVDEGLVSGWDDPRMPTISGMRRRGYPAKAIMDFVRSTGVTKNVMTVPLSALEYYVRTELDQIALRVAVVENPIKVKIVNYDKSETFDVTNNPHDEASGTHKISFSNEIWIDGSDFSDNPPPKYKRLTVGGVVQLRGAGKIKCLRKVGDILECEITDEKAKGVIQYVDARDCVPVTIRTFEPLLKEGTDLNDENINRDSLHESQGYAEKWLAEQNDVSLKYQFVRKGYYVLDHKNGFVFNKTIGLREGF